MSTQSSYIYFRLFLASFLMHSIVGCSLNTRVPNQSQITISLAPHQNSYQNAARTNSFHSSHSNLTATTSGFDCFGVNVIGYDIPIANTNRPPSTELLNQLLSSTSTCTYLGIMAILPSDTLTATLNVPSGPKRLIQVFGIVDSNQTICKGTSTPSLNQGSFFEVGRTVTDLYTSNQSVEIDNSYNNLTTIQQAARQARCNNNSYGNTQVTYTSLIQAEPHVVSYWPLGEPGTTSATDLMHSVVPGNLSYGVTAQTGAAGPLVNETSYSITLNAIDGVAPDTNTSSINFTGTSATGALTFEAWVKVPTNGCASAVSAFVFIWNSPSTVAESRSITLGCNNSKKAIFQTTTSSTTESVSSKNTINDNQWHHLVGTLEDGNISLYVDGDINNSSTTNLTATDVNFSTTGHGATYIGQYRTRTASSNTDTFVVANISQVAIYTNALSANNVALHYQTALKN